MKVQLLRPWVINGAVEAAGKQLDLPRFEAMRLEEREIAERLESEWEPVPEFPELGKLRDVLVFVPVYRLEAETVKALMNFEWDGALSLLLQRDNPENPEVSPTDSLRDRRRANIAGRVNILHQYQRGREIFLSGPWQAMLVIESDIVPPPDTLAKLAALNADCAYGVYRFRVSNVINIFERYPNKNGRRPRNEGESLSVKPHLLKRAVRLGKFPCSGAGLGCVLIRRKVLEELEFRMEELHGAHCDTYFTRDVLQGGYTQRADMSVICGHVTEDGRVLWPELPEVKC